MEKEIQLIDKSKEVIEKCNNHIMGEFFLDETEEDNYTAFIVCSLPIWMRYIDYEMMRKPWWKSKEEMVNGYYYWNLSEEKIKNFLVDDCVNSDFVIKTCWVHSNGDSRDYVINGETEGELIANIVTNYHEFKDGVKYQRICNRYGNK